MEPYLINGSSIIDAVANEDTAGFGLETAEALLDANVLDGIAEAVPVASLIKAVYKTARTIQDQIFARNLIRFLVSLSSIPKEERAKQVEKLLDEKERKRVGETLLILIGKANHVNKPELLARAFKAFIEEKIDRETFDNFLYVIDQLNIAAIPRLKLFYHWDGHSPTSEHDHKQHLLALGLMALEFAELKPATAADSMAHLGFNSKPAGRCATNRLGRAFIEHVLTEQTARDQKLTGNGGK